MVLLLAFLPAGGLAQNPLTQNTLKVIESRFDSAIGGAMSYMRSERPKRGLDLHDNLNLWKPGLGVGAQIEVAKNWTLRVDLDRYRQKFPGANGRENLDTLMLGVQYNLGGD